MRGWNSRWARQVGAGLALLVLGACGSRPPASAPVVVSPMIAPPPRPAPAAPLPAAPIVPPPVARPIAPPVLSGPPVPPAIAARFPEPAVDFATPAFAPGRTAYTTNDELRAILRGLERSGLDSPRGTDVAVLPLGTSQSGLPLEALAFTRAPPVVPVAAPPPDSDASAPAAAAVTPPTAVVPPMRRPAVLIVAGQHGDEPAGSEALIVIAQDLAAGRLDRVLDQVDVYLLPRANPDGAVLGQRAVADGSDLNRDHLLLRTPEAQAMAQLVRDVAPVVVLDLHEYTVDAGFAARFGGVQRFDALLDVATVANLRPFVARAAEEWFRAPLATSLAGAGFSTEWYYTVAADPADRLVSMGGVGPQIGRNANGLKNAVSLLVETRGGGIGRTDFKRRVDVAVLAVRNVLGNAAAHAADLGKLRQFVERDIVADACRGEAVIDAAPTPSEKALAVLDADTGAIKRVTVSWDSALELRVLRSRPRPCGYWLAPSENDAARRLRQLGIEVQQLDEPGEVRGETYRETGRDAAPAAGGSGARLRVHTAPVLLDLGAGGYYVSMEQPLANLAIAALEPESPAGYAANGVITSVASEARVLDRPRMRMVNLP